MWKLDVRQAANEPHTLVFVCDEKGVLRWSGPTLLNAFRFLADSGQVEVVVDVASVIAIAGNDLLA